MLKPTEFLNKTGKPWLQKKEKENFEKLFVFCLTCIL